MAEGAHGKRTVRRELFLGVGAYFLALGGGVLIDPGVAIVFVVVGTILIALALAGSESAQRAVPALGRLPFVENQGFVAIGVSEVAGGSGKAPEPTPEERAAIRVIRDELIDNRNTVNSMIRVGMTTPGYDVFRWSQWAEERAALARLSDPAPYRAASAAYRELAELEKGWLVPGTEARSLDEADLEQLGRVSDELDRAIEALDEEQA